MRVLDKNGNIREAGVITSIGLTMPAEFTVTGSPLLANGTLAVSKATESANTVWAGPASGAAAAPEFRALGLADLPTNIVQRAMAQGTTSSPTTTSATLVDIPEMSVTLTTTGGDLLVCWAGPLDNTVAGNEIDVAVKLDAGTAQTIVVINAKVASYVEATAGTHLFTGVSAASHTVKAQWLSSAGTSRSFSTIRRLIVLELAR